MALELCKCGSGELAAGKIELGGQVLGYCCKVCVVQWIKRYKTVERIKRDAKSA